MEKQLRINTYKVNRDQIFKVFGKDIPNPETGIGDKDVNDNPIPEHRDDSEDHNHSTPPKQPRTERLAARKSRAKSHRMAMEKVISIATSRKNKMKPSDTRVKEQKWMSILITQPQQINHIPEGDLGDDSEDPDDDLGHDQVNQQEHELGSELSGSPRQSEGDHDDAFLESPQSVASMTDTDRLDLSGLFNSSSNSGSPGLEWDESPTTTNLTSPLSHVNLFEGNDSDLDISMLVNMSDPAASTPAPRHSVLSDDVFGGHLNPPQTPERRITRQMLSSGEYSLFSSNSDILSPFQRQNPLRRPLAVVVDRSIPNIRSVDRQASRPRPLTGRTASPQSN